jgi:hypothetical protein
MITTVDTGGEEEEENDTYKRHHLDELRQIQEHNAQQIIDSHEQHVEQQQIPVKPDFSNMWPSRMPIWRLILFSLWPLAMNTCFTFNHGGMCCVIESYYC